MSSKKFHPKNGLPKIIEKMALGKIIQNGDQKIPPQKWSPKTDRKNLKYRKKLLFKMSSKKFHPKNGLPKNGSWKNYSKW